MSSRKCAIAIVLLAAFSIGNCQPKDTQVVQAQKPLPVDSAASVTAPTDTGLTNAARFIAGIRPLPGCPFAALADRAKWLRYQKLSDSGWSRFDRNKTTRIRSFADTLFTGQTTGKTVFYPFSGPDFLYVHAFFPHASRYVMFGLEPPGTVPDLASVPADSVGKVVFEAGKAIEEVLSFSFFKTNDMKDQLATDYINGTLPVILLFAARTNHEIIAVRQFTVDSAGTLRYDSASTCSGKVCYGRGFELEMRDTGNAEKHTVVYFSCDASNGGMKVKKGVRRYLENLEKGTSTFIKAASYLMHKDYFSVVRNIVLTRSGLILQDDSGIPYRLFSPKIWTMRLYGRYVEPIKLFKDYTQKDLADAYAANAKKMGLRLGYSPQSDVQLAIRKQDN